MRQVEPTLDLEEAQRIDWDAVVVGAGPAGSMAARSIVQRGHRVLLLDRETFPRAKVCGCCVNPAALKLIARDERDLIVMQGCRLGKYELAYGGQVSTVPLSGGIAISRERLDLHLIESAIRSGVAFLDQTKAVLATGSSRARLKLTRGSSTKEIHGKVAVLATGLGGNCHKAVGANPRHLSWRSYVGGGTILSPQTHGFEMGTVSMACHPFGYVGLVKLEDGRLDVAAAFDGRFVGRVGGLSQAAHQVLTESGLPCPADILDQPWQGTPKLTHRRTQLHGAGYLVVGDAAGYVEPFTGEGIAWAMASGRAVALFAERAITEPISLVGTAWSQEHQRLLGGRMRSCRALSFLLRQPTLVRLAVHALRWRPQLVKSIERSLSKPFSISERSAT